VGAKLFIDSQLGTDPLDALAIAVASHTGTLIGTVSAVIAAAFLLLWTYWNRRFPPVTSFATMIGVGYLIDLWNHLGVVPGNPWLLLVTGLLMVSVASALIIMSGIGVRIMDLVALTMVRRFRWKFTHAKMLFEMGFVGSALLLGGPVGIGTIAFVLFVGLLIAPMMYCGERFLGIRNHSLALANAPATTSLSTST
jgi:uncharacterized membrane protein YczE